MVPLAASVASLVEPVSPVAPVSPLVLGIVLIAVPSGHVHGLHHAHRLVGVAGPLHVDWSHILIRVLVRLPLDGADLAHRLAVNVTMVLLRRVPTVSSTVSVLLVILDVDDDNILASLVSISLQASQLADSAQLGQLGQETGSIGLLNAIFMVFSVCGMTNNPLILNWTRFRFTLLSLTLLILGHSASGGTVDGDCHKKDCGQDCEQLHCDCLFAAVLYYLIHWMRLHSAVALTELYIGKISVHKMENIYGTQSADAVREEKRTPG